MTDELKKTTPDANPEVTDPEYLAYKKEKAEREEADRKREEAKSRIMAAIAKDPDLELVFNTPVKSVVFKDGKNVEVSKTLKEEILEKPKTILDDDLFTSRLQFYSKAFVESERAKNQNKGGSGGAKADPEERQMRGADRAPEGKFRASSLSDEELKKKGFSDANIAIIKASGL